MSNKRIAVIGSAVALTVAVVASLLAATEAALAALGIAMLGQLTWLVLWGRWAGRRSSRMHREVVAICKQHNKIMERYETAQRDVIDIMRTIRADLTAAQRTIGQQGEQLGRAKHTLDQQAKRMEQAQQAFRQQTGLLQKSGERDQRLRNEILSVSAAVHRVPGLTAELTRVYERLVQHPHPMPELGGWAISPSTLLWILDHIETTSPHTVLECGSGSSTIWMAAALEHLGGERTVTALESSEYYAAITRDELGRLGLLHRASVIHAPLIDTDLPGRPPQPWFDLTQLELAAPIDLLLVDGPVGATATEARYPAFPLLAKHLASNAIVILDDTYRPEEARIAELWGAETHHGQSLQEIRVVDRSTVFVVHETATAAG